MLQLRRGLCVTGIWRFVGNVYQGLDSTEAKVMYTFPPQFLYQIVVCTKTPGTQMISPSLFHYSRERDDVPIHPGLLVQFLQQESSQHSSGCPPSVCGFAVSGVNRSVLCEQWGHCIISDTRNNVCHQTFGPRAPLMYELTKTNTTSIKLAQPVQCADISHHFHPFDTGYPLRPHFPKTMSAWATPTLTKNKKKNTIPFV